MVIVVEFLAADEDAHREDVGRGIGAIEIAVAPVVPEAVDHAGRPEGNPGNLRDPHQDAWHGAEQNDVDDQHQDDAGLLARPVNMPLQPVIRCAVAVAAQGFLVACFLDVEKNAAPQHPVDSQHLRAVRIFRSLALGVMLAMHCRPFPGSHAGGQPQPETEEVRWQGRQVERAVGLMAVQKDGDGSDGDVRQAEEHQPIAPPGQIKNTG